MFDLTRKSAEKRLSLLFMSLALLFTGSQFFSYFPYSWLPKILPILVLIGWSVARKPQSLQQKSFILGLVFSICGDILLAIKNGELFVFGLGAFLIAHLFYIVSLMPLEASRVKPRLPALFAYVLLGIGVFSLFAPNLGPLLLPVSVYMLVLLLMACWTLLSRHSNYYLIVGGCAFVLSDSLIGLNKFYSPIPYSEVWIMASYYLAQFCLMTGMMRNKIIFDGKTAAAEPS